MIILMHAEKTFDRIQIIQISQVDKNNLGIEENLLNPDKGCAEKCKLSMPGLFKPCTFSRKTSFHDCSLPSSRELSSWNGLSDECICMPETMSHAMLYRFVQVVYSNGVIYGEYRLSLWRSGTSAAKISHTGAICSHD